MVIARILKVHKDLTFKRKTGTMRVKRKTMVSGQQKYTRGSWKSGNWNG